MNDATVQLAVVALIGTFITGLFAVIGQLITIRGQRLAAAEAKVVKETLATKAIATDEKLESIHVLVNSDMGKQKLRTSQALRRIADLTNAEADIAAAADAEEEYKKHQGRQAVVDTAAAAAAAAAAGK